MGKSKQTVVFIPLLQGGPVDKTIPKVLETKESIADILQVDASRMINCFGLLSEIEVVTSAPKPLLKATLADSSGKLHVKFWESRHIDMLKEADGKLVLPPTCKCIKEFRTIDTGLSI